MHKIINQPNTSDLDITSNERAGRRRQQALYSKIARYPWGNLVTRAITAWP